MLGIFCLQSISLINDGDENKFPLTLKMNEDHFNGIMIRYVTFENHGRHAGDMNNGFAHWLMRVIKMLYENDPYVYDVYTLKPDATSEQQSGIKSRVDDLADLSETVKRLSLS